MRISSSSKISRLSAVAFEKTRATLGDRSKAWALAMGRAGKSVLFVHHSGKGGGQRGTSRKEDVLDTVIALRRPTDYAPEQGARFEIHFEKARGLFGDDAKRQADSVGSPEVHTVADTKDAAAELIAAFG